MQHVFLPDVLRLYIPEGQLDNFSWEKSNLGTTFSILSLFPLLRIKTRTFYILPWDVIQTNKEGGFSAGLIANTVVFKE